MTAIELTGAAAIARGSPHTSQSAHAARSGLQKAQNLQGATTTTTPVPVETSRAVTQTQVSEGSRMSPELPVPDHASRLRAESAQQPPRTPNLALAKPMTAALLHELRLQQELNKVQEEMNDRDT